MTYIEKLTKLNACGKAVEFCRGHRSLQSAWDACERGDWMLWLLGKLSGPSESASRRKLVLAACQCARLSLRHVPKGEMRPLTAVRTAERWARREEGVTLEMVRDAADAADAAAYAAADAADAADAAGAAAIAAADAAYAAYAAARVEVLKRCAAIVRKAYPRAPRLRGAK